MPAYATADTTLYNQVATSVGENGCSDRSTKYALCALAAAVVARLAVRASEAR
jgi:hypothetical protein